VLTLQTLFWFFRSATALCNWLRSSLVGRAFHFHTTSECAWLLSSCYPRSHLEGIFISAPHIVEEIHLEIHLLDQHLRQRGHCFYISTAGTASP